MVAIVFSHPWHGSFNKAILDTITAKYDKINKEYEVIDLCKDNFNPSFSEQELSGYSAGKAFDPLVLKYQEIVGRADEIIFIFPIWWGYMPAILKGFFDKVLLKDFAYNYEGGWNPLLKINKSTIITTAENGGAFLESMIKDGIANGMLAGVGIRNTEWLSITQVVGGGLEKRQEFLKQVEERA